MTRLIIAEKPSVAAQIAQVVGATVQKDGYLQGDGYLVSWCIGHLLELASAERYDAKYEKWRHEDLPIIPDTWQYSVGQNKQKQLSILQKLMADPAITSIVCATDAGREGELIFRWVYEYCQCTKPVLRLWISSMEESAIRNGMDTLKDAKEYDALYQAALCRAQADWLVGINATRLFSILYGETLNVGRVMTPTLALLVKRTQDFLAFQPQTFYIPQIQLNDSEISFVAKGARLSTREEADAICSQCHGQSVHVSAVHKRNSKQAPPKLYDLTTLQRDANRICGFTAQQTLDYLQSLYEKKLVTYPRTDSRYLTQDMQQSMTTIVARLTDGKPYAALSNLSQVVDDRKVNDHHAIVPTLHGVETATEDLPQSEQRVFQLIVCRLLCAVAEAQELETVEATLHCAGVAFVAKGKTIIRQGWKEIERTYYHVEDEGDEETALPALLENQAFSSAKAIVYEGKTSAPKPFTEDTLLCAMAAADYPSDDRNADNDGKIGLGTPATRAAVIEKLVKIGFVERKNKKLFPTQKGINLIDVLPEPVKSPVLTAQWEEELAKIEQGESDAKAFMDRIHAMIDELLVTSETSSAHRYLFGTDSKQESVGICPRCGATVREKHKGFFCENRDCQFALWKDNRFFGNKKKKIDKKVAAALLKEGRIFISGLFSQKTGKTYDADIVLADSGTGYVGFALEFPDQGGTK